METLGTTDMTLVFWQVARSLVSSVTYITVIVPRLFGGVLNKHVATALLGAIPLLLASAIVQLSSLATHDDADRQKMNTRQVYQWPHWQAWPLAARQTRARFAAA